MNDPQSAAAPLRLRPEIDDLPTLVEWIEEFGERNGVAVADTHALTLAAEELFANTIRHSAPPATWVEFSLAMGSDEVVAVYSDDAAGFDPTAYPEVDTTLPVEQRPIGGLGIHFIRRTMRTFRYERVGGRNVIAFGRALTKVGPPR